MRLNLGCGRDVRPGYTNVDLYGGRDIDVVDLSKMPWPWADRSCGELLMLDFLEHFPRGRTRDIIQECHRVLRPGGLLTIQVPDMNVLGMALARSVGTPCNRCGFKMIGGIDPCKCGATWDEIQDAAIGRIYGGQDYTGNFHNAGFTVHSLTALLNQLGFHGVQMMEEDLQWDNWNFKVCARRF